MVDEAEEVVATALDELDFTFQVIAHFFFDLFGGAQNHGERRPELVGDVGEKAVLELVQFF